MLAVAVLVRAELVRRTAAPWIFSDELLHAELAKSVAAGDFFTVRGRSLAVSYLYPLMIAPAWFFHDVEPAYAAAKFVNVLAMSATAVPIYVWGRMLVSARAALVAATLTLLLPWLALTGTLMQENLALPTMLFALFGLALALQRPTLRRQLLAATLTAVAIATRFEAAILLLVVPTAVLLSRERLRPLAPLLGTVALFMGAAGAQRLARGGSLASALGLYPQVAETHYSVTGFVHWLWIAGAEIALACGVLPMCALLVLIAARGGRTREERHFLAVAGAAVGWLVVLGGASGAWTPVGLKERYAFYGVPLSLLALMLWIERGAPHRRTVAALSAGLAGVAAFLPLPSLFENPTLLGNAPGLILFHTLAGWLGGAGSVRVLILSAGLAAAAVVATVSRTHAARLLPMLVGLFLACSSAAATRAMTVRSHEVATEAALPASRGWVDAALPARASVSFLNTTGFELELRRRDYYRVWLPFWQAEFWNRRVEGVYTLAAPEPIPLPQAHGRVDWTSGRILGDPLPSYLLVDPRFEVSGHRVAGTPRLVLYRLQPPARLARAVEGVYADGLSAVDAAYDRWTWVGRRERAVTVDVEVPGSAPTRLTVSIGPLVGADSGPRLARVARRASYRVAGRRRIVLTPPPPPFRIELHFDPPLEVGGRLVGARVALSP